MKIIATECKAKDLKPGDLFSTASQEYWDIVHTDNAVGEKVYIRTNSPTSKEQENDLIYRITIDSLSQEEN